jgi:Rap1a immunity proteins
MDDAHTLADRANAFIAELERSGRRKTRRWSGMVALICCAMAINAEARADGEDGNRLYADCTSKDMAGIFNRGLCVGYITAIADVMHHTAVAGRTACFSENAAAGHLQELVTQFLADHPELRPSTAEALIAQALSEAFPCH